MRMNPNLAEEHLQTIRTLMERSALYRRALAPIMLLAGVLGLIAAAMGLLLRIDSPGPFGALWLITAAVVVTGAFLVARRQAFKDAEIFWSPPTRRVAHALSLPLLAGFVAGLLLILKSGQLNVDVAFVVPFLWALFYGCALHSAGPFMPRGIKWLGWIFVGLTLVSLCFTFLARLELNLNWIMGLFFGGLHFAYGIYLYFTEKKNSTA